MTSLSLSAGRTVRISYEGLSFACLKCNLKIYPTSGDTILLANVDPDQNADMGLY